MVYCNNLATPLVCDLAAAAAAKQLQSCLTLCDPIDSSPPGSSVHGIFQAGVLEWGAIVFSVCDLRLGLFLYQWGPVLIC